MKIKIKAGVGWIIFFFAATGAALAYAIYWWVQQQASSDYWTDVQTGKITPAEGEELVDAGLASNLWGGRRNATLAAHGISVGQYGATVGGAVTRRGGLQ